MRVSPAMNAAVSAGVFLYMAAMLAVGWWASRRIRSLSDFLVAGRRLPFYLAATTLFATWFGAGSCMGASGTAYTDGLLGVISDPFAAGLSLIIAGLFYVACLRRLKLLTVTDVFGIYYGGRAEVCASVLMVPVYIGWLGSQMVALGYIMKLLTGMDPTAGIVLGAVIVLLYTYAGGMWAVTLTDFIQVVILLLGLSAIYPVVIGKVGGFKVLFASTPADFWRILPPAGSGYTDWVGYIGQWALMGLGCVVGQDLIQRSLSSKDESVAKYSAVTAGVCYCLIGLIPITLGFAGRILMPGMENPELIIPELAAAFLPSLVLALFLGALVSAIMSSADSSLLAATSLTTKNILLRIFPRLRKRSLLAARATTVVMTALSMLLALKVQQIYNLMVNSWATLLVGIFVPVTAALYWKKANAPAAWTSMLLGTGVWLAYILVMGGDLTGDEGPVMYCAAVYGGLASLAGYLAATLLRYKDIKTVKPACERA